MSPAAPPHPCRLTLLGGFRLDYDDQPVSTSDPTSRLLALLALQGRHRPVPRSVLADRLWADGAPSRASARLRNALWRLPSVDGRPVITGDGTTVALAPYVSVDLWQAESSARALTDDDADTAPDLSAFESDLLPQWVDDWLLLEREAYRQTRLHALERASERLCRRGSYAAALQAALAAVACEPLRETAHRRVIEVHLVEGNHAEALRQYQSFRRLLAAELGLPPSPAIRSLVAPLLGRPIDVHRRPGER